MSCSSSAVCTAVGYYNSNSTWAVRIPLVERWNGASWMLQSAPTPSGASSALLEAVSCASTTVCTAIGVSSNRNGPKPLIERWNGITWAIQTVAVPTGATNVTLTKISCPSTSACTVVGSYIHSAGTQLTLAEHWTGASWSIQPTANPSGALRPVLTGVSRPSITSCSAVGYYGVDSDAERTLSEHE